MKQETGLLIAGMFFIAVSIQACIYANQQQTRLRNELRIKMAEQGMCETFWGQWQKCK